LSASISCWVGHLRTYSDERLKGSVDVRSGCPALALNPPCHLVCSRGFLYAVFDLPLTFIVKMPFALGIILSLAVSFHRCSSRHPSRIRRLIITRTKSLLITQQGAGGLGGVAGIVEKAVPSLVRCGEFLIILRFESVEKNGRPPVLRLWPGSLSRRDASLLRRYLYFSR